MARDHMWTDEQIARCMQICHSASRMEHRISGARLGYTKKCKVCESWTVDDYPESACHLCHPEAYK